MTGSFTAENAALRHVHIRGQVVNPGVYKIEVGSRIFQTAEAAGGLTDETDGVSLNVAEIIQDGIRISAPFMEEAESGAVMPGSGSHGATVPG